MSKQQSLDEQVDDLVLNWVMLHNPHLPIDGDAYRALVAAIRELVISETDQSQPETSRPVSDSRAGG